MLLCRDGDGYYRGLAFCVRHSENWHVLVPGVLVLMWAVKLEVLVAEGYQVWLRT